MIDSETPNNSGFDIKIILDSIVSNVFSRIMGFMMRLILISLFLAMEALTVVLGVIVFIVWIFLPFILVWLIIDSFTKINV